MGATISIRLRLASFDFGLVQKSPRTFSSEENDLVLSNCMVVLDEDSLINWKKHLKGRLYVPPTDYHTNH